MTYSSQVNNISDSATSAVRDQVIRHKTNSNTFNEAYVNERVRFHVQNAFLERPSEDSLLKAFAHISLTCDPRAPNKIIGKLPADPAINALEHERARLKTAIAQNYSKINLAKGTPLGLKYDSIQASLQAAKSKRRRLARGNNRQDYFRRRHTEEIE